MSMLSTIARAFLGEPLQQRSIEDYPTLEDQLAALQRQPRPWRPASTSEAMGVPAIFSAVSLISNTVGSLSLEAFRDGALMTDQAPRLIIRPNPFSTPRDFFRDSAYYLATLGEAWWWVASRDIDDAPLSLYPVPPWEVTVAANDRNRLRPIIKWADRTIPNEDMRHITYLPDRSGLRGVGPLQMCGAAASVAVESQEWAANFYASNIPSIIGETDADMSPQEMAILKAQWLEDPNNNMIKFVTNGLKLHDFTVDPARAQLTSSREFQVGEVARMFDMPGALLDFNAPGSSLTYQNTEGVWGDFQRRCLSPHYLEPIEQEMTDLLTRSTAARFNTNQLLRADVKTRYEVYGVGIDKGIITPEEARVAEGLAAGNVDFAPVPFAPPQAIPTLLPPNMESRSAMGEWRCSSCDRKIAETEGAGTQIRCRCGEMNTATGLQTRSDDSLALAVMALASREQSPIIVHAATQEAPIVNVHNITPEAKPIRRTVTRRNADKQIEETIEEAV